MNVLFACVVLALATLPWVLALRARVGGLAAVGAVSLAVPTGVVALMFVSHATGAPLGVAVPAALALAGIGGWVWFFASRPQRAAAGPMPIARVWPAGIGAVIAVGTFVLAEGWSGASHRAWAMLGDSASQFVEARLLLAAGGLAPPPLRNPVPLTPALVASVAAPGRPDADAAAMFNHDLNSYATTWAVLIIVACALAGVVGYAVVRHTPQLTGALAHVTVGATSLLPLGWFWTGYPVKFGFINAHVVYVILLAAIVAYLGTLKRPWLGLALQLLAVILVILTWSPLAIIPAALAMVHGIGVVGAWSRLSVAARVTSIAVAATAVTVGLVLGLPLLLSARGSLNIAGGLAEFPKPMLPLAAVVLIGLVLAIPSRFAKASIGIMSVGASALAGLALVLILSGQLTGPWSYYPHKYAWLATAVVLTVALPQAMCTAVQLRSRVLRWVIYAGSAMAVLVSLGLGSWWLPGDAALLRNSLPVLILVEDDLPDQGQGAESVPAAVYERVALERLTIPWRSSIANDYRAAFWLMHLERERAILRGDGPAASELWVLANFHEEPADLCRLAGVVPRGLTVHTDDAGLADELAQLCPAEDIVIAPLPVRS